ncbi:MAG TPA: flagellar biosynthesis regulator FlaF [Acetobacteraceae bacterium]|nr:flagellar biosynthesis regulator FlaF [Acetobacteraceae bacterium]
MRTPVQRYQVSGLEAVAPRETEIVAFTICNERLAGAADARARIEALHKTHQLWSLIVRDVAMEANGLPADLKTNLTDLGIWAMTYCIHAMAMDLPLAPLVQVNADMIEGLRAQAASPAVATTAASLASVAATL